MARQITTGPREEAAVDEIRDRAVPLREPRDVASILDVIGDVDYVLLGEATHGTSEFYSWRARISARLIEQQENAFVAVEGDWPDCYHVNEFVRGEHRETMARDALSTYTRWPTWMWANWEFLEFADWLHGYNMGRDPDEMAGFYGLDVYSLYDSIHRVVDYLERTDLELAEQARNAYHCFEPFGEDAREYAQNLRLVPDTCEDEVIEVLSNLRERRPEFEALDGEPFFDAEQNALVVDNAEAYYRAMGRGGANSWNVRDRHMAETLDRLVDHYGPDATGIVWAHNTHVGDARYTDMPLRGNLNLGQLVRERADPDDVAIVGFGTHHGSVIAADGWGDPNRAMDVPDAKPGSYEALFHRAGVGDCVIDLPDDGPLAEKRGHRAIGVSYSPSYEGGNYVPTELGNRYDAFVSIDETEALHPLKHEEPEATEPETYPWGV